MKIFLTLLLTMTANVGFAQQLVDVADLTVRLSAKEEKLLYYSFAKGDQITFNFSENDGHALSEFSVSDASTDT